jgi:hypothetical protein
VSGIEDLIGRDIFVHEILAEGWYPTILGGLGMEPKLDVDLVPGDSIARFISSQIAIGLMPLDGQKTAQAVIDRVDARIQQVVFVMRKSELSGIVGANNFVIERDLPAFYATMDSHVIALELVRALSKLS